MKLSLRRMTLAAIALTVCGGVAWSAGNWSTLPIVGQGSFCGSTVTGSTGTICGQTIPAGPQFLTGSEIIPADTVATGGASPQTVAVPVTILGNYWGTPRNVLDNGALNITNTNGTATVTGQINAAAAVVANMAADRWLLSTNVAAGAGRTAIVTASPAPPAGFTNSMKVFRTSGALTQPICVVQEVTTPQSVQLAGQVVTFSFSAAALAGLSADNGNVINAVIFTGTGTDQGFGSWTASPAITPAWTGISTPLNQAISVTTTFARFAVQATIPSTATEIGVALCFTPTATGAGATDGFAWTGAQLERSGSASAFEFRSKTAELAQAQAFFYTIAEGAATTTRAMCMASSVTLALCGLQFPVPMYAVPTMTYTNGFATATTTAGSTLGACNTLRTSTLVAGNAASVNGVLLDCVATTVPAAGSSDYLADNGGSGVIKAWAGM